MESLIINTSGEGFYDITNNLIAKFDHKSLTSGICTIFCPHTSCALTISEGFDPQARQDIEKFLQHLAPRNLAFIKHNAEGPDDSPSHMKSVLLHQSITLLIEHGKPKLGSWQSIFLAEFRDRSHKREVWFKVISHKHLS